MTSAAERILINVTYEPDVDVFHLNEDIIWFILFHTGRIRMFEGQGRKQ